MLHSASSRHDEDDPCMAGATPVCGRRHHRRFAAGLASSSWSFTDDMDCSVAVNYSRYDPPPTPVAFQSPSPSFMPTGMHHSTAPGIGELHCYPSSHHTYVEATPPYFTGDRRLQPDRAPSGVYGGLTMPYPYTTSVAGGSGPDYLLRGALLAGDTRVITASNLSSPPQSMFAWRGAQTSCLSTVDPDPTRAFPPFYPNIVVDQRSCRSPVGADRKSVIILVLYIIG